MAVIQPLNRITASPGSNVIVSSERSFDLRPGSCVGSTENGACVRGQILFHGEIERGESHVGLFGRLKRVFRGSPEDVSVWVSLPGIGAERISTHARADSCGRFSAEFDQLPGLSGPAKNTVWTHQASVEAEVVQRSWINRKLGWLPGFASFTHAALREYRHVGTIDVVVPGPGRKLCVLSDIDGTALRMDMGRTLRTGEYAWAEGMCDLLKRMEKHGTVGFVSGSPVELYPELWRTLKEDSGFKLEAGLHLKNWWTTPPRAQRGYKLETILDISKHLAPNTDLVLIGDDPESDPVICDAIRKIINEKLDVTAIRALLGDMGVEEQYFDVIVAHANTVREHQIYVAGVWIREWSREGIDRPESWPKENEALGIHYVSGSMAGARNLGEYFNREVLPRLSSRIS